MNADAVVRARLDSQTKRRVVAILDNIGLNTSDLIRLTFNRVASEGRIPFPLEAPNTVTQAALDELDTGQGERFSSVAELMSDLDD